MITKNTIETELCDETLNFMFKMIKLPEHEFYIFLQELLLNNNINDVIINNHSLFLHIDEEARTFLREFHIKIHDPLLGWAFDVMEEEYKACNAQNTKTALSDVLNIAKKCVHRYIETKRTPKIDIHYRKEIKKDLIQTITEKRSRSI